MAQPLSEKTALVTGGSRGIGRAIVERLCQDGAGVAFSYVRSEDAANDLVRELTGKGARVHAIRTDLSRLDELENLFATAEQALGGLDILVNNAGESHLATFAETTEADFDHLFQVNVKAVFFAIQLANSKLRKGGRVINLSSINTVMHGPGIATYAATKAAVEQFTLVAAKELALRKITVNTVSPGPVDTDMLRAAQTPQALDMAAAMTPLRRLGEPADVADVVAFLAGTDARWITGQNIRVTGGLA